MDKKFIVEFANKYHINYQVSSNDVDYLLTSYCEEFNKDSHKTEILIALLKQMRIINQYINTALDYYIKKYEINTLKNKEGNIIKFL